MQRFADGELHGTAALSSRLPAMRYGDVTFELADDEGQVLTWPAVVALTAESVIPTSGFVMVPRQSSRGERGKRILGKGIGW